MRKTVINRQEVIKNIRSVNGHSKSFQKQRRKRSFSDSFLYLCRRFAPQIAMMFLFCFFMFSVLVILIFLKQDHFEALIEDQKALAKICQDFIELAKEEQAKRDLEIKELEKSLKKTYKAAFIVQLRGFTDYSMRDICRDYRIFEFFINKKELPPVSKPERLNPVKFEPPYDRLVRLYGYDKTIKILQKNVDYYYRPRKKPVDVGTIYYDPDNMPREFHKFRKIPLSRLESFKKQ